MSIQGNETVDSIHKKLGHIMWEYVGMGRTAEGLKKGIAALKEIRKEFETNLFIPGSKEGDVYKRQTLRNIVRSLSKHTQSS